MKLSKRNNKDKQQPISAPSTPPSKAGNDQKALLPGALAALGGILLAGALLVVTLSGSQQQQTQALIQSWGSGQAEVSGLRAMRSDSPETG